MPGHSNRAHTRATTPVRNAKGFMQVQMANVCAVVAGAAKTDLRI